VLKKNDILILDCSGSFYSYVEDVLSNIQSCLSDDLDCYFCTQYGEYIPLYKTNLDEIKRQLKNVRGGSGDSLQQAIDAVNRKEHGKYVLVITDGWCDLNFTEKDDKKYSVLYTDTKPVYNNSKIYYSLKLDSHTIDFLYKPEDDTIERYKMANNTIKYNL